MSTTPVIFLAFSNDRQDDHRFLRNLPDEERNVREALEPAIEEGLCELVIRSNTRVGELIDVFQKYRGHIAVFHFGGHAGGLELFMEDAKGTPELAHADGLAEFLGKQEGLEFVFLNGCSTQPQVEGLLEAGVPAVIATSQAIQDSIATQLSQRFYAALAGGATIGDAFDESVATVRLTHGGNTRGERVPKEISRDENKWPWELYVPAGGEVNKEWSLPKAVGNPLYGLPDLPEMDLPESPYRYLEWFKREHAEIFFGRGEEIRKLYELVTSKTASPIVLFYGASGVGKSSLLHAGLLPRLESNHGVKYVRRNKERGLFGTLKDALEVEGDTPTLLSAWKKHEEETEKPLVIMLDQVEEVYTRPTGDSKEEVERIITALEDLFQDRDQRPLGKLVLGFRKEWLAEIEKRVQEKGLPRTKFFLERISRSGIMEIVRGPTSTPRLRQKYQLNVEEALPIVIADDLWQDRDSALAPTLQIQLSKMWDEVESDTKRRFAVIPYQELSKGGFLLNDFLVGQMEAVKEKHPQAVTSGLALDILSRHTTPLGTAKACTTDALEQTYTHQKGLLRDLTGLFKELYLLVDPAGDARSSRLAHDTLAPLIQAMLKDSDLPGQQATRVLGNRMSLWENGEEISLLDKADLAIVQGGLDGMRALSEEEHELVEKSQERQEKEVVWKRRRWVFGVGAVVIIIALSVAFGILGVQAKKSEEQAVREADISLVQALSARSLAADFPDKVALYAVEANRRDSSIIQARKVLFDVQNRFPTLKGIYHGHTETVWNVAFSPDGKVVASAARDSTIRRWDSTTGEEIEPLIQLDHSNVWSVAFSVTGDTIASASQDNSNDVRLWSSKSGEEIAQLSGHGNIVQSVIFSPNGRLLASASDDDTVILWNPKTGEQISQLSGHSDDVRAVAFNPAGDRLASGSWDSTIRIWDVRSGEVIDTLAGHTDKVSSVVFSPDGSTLASASWDDTVLLWDIASGEVIDTLTGHSEDVRSVAFSSRGDILASASNDKTVRLWDVSAESPSLLIQTLAGHTDYVISVAFSPDGNTLATASVDKTVRLWNPVSGQEEMPLIGNEGFFTRVSFSPDGKYLVTSDEIIRLWDRASMKEFGQLGESSSYIDHVAFSPDGAIVASTSDGEVIRLWDVFTRREVVMLNGHAGEILHVAFSPDGKTLASASEDETIRLWSIPDGEAIGTLEGHTDEVRSVAFSPDGKTLASGSDDKTIRLWKVSTGEVIDTLEGHTDQVWEVAFNPAGDLLASASWDETVRLWDLSSMQEAAQLIGHTDEVNSVSFSPDGTTLVSSSWDSSVSVWDVATREEVAQLKGHADDVLHASYSPDGQTIASASEDGTIRLWNVGTTARTPQVCRVAGRNFSLDEWQEALGDRPYACTCAQFPPGEGVPEGEYENCEKPRG